MCLSANNVLLQSVSFALIGALLSFCLGLSNNTEAAQHCHSPCPFLQHLNSHQYHHRQSHNQGTLLMRIKQPPQEPFARPPPLLVCGGFFSSQILATKKDDNADGLTSLGEEEDVAQQCFQPPEV